MSLDVNRLALVRGSNHPGKGFSAMEAVAFAAGEAWSERPRCASPAITEWMIAWNDGLDDVSRQSLRRYIWRLVGSRGTRADERMRQWMAADWLVRWYAPGWLAAAGLRGHATRLTRLSPVRCEADVVKAWPVVRAASRAARAERDMAWRSAAAVVAAHDWGTAGAVWAAIADATWGAAGSAARAVVWSSADPSAPGRIAVPMWDAACDAAADAAGALAWVAVRDAARREAAAGMLDSSMGPVQAAAAMIEEATPLALRREAPAGADRTRPTVDPLTAEWRNLSAPGAPVMPAAGLVGALRSSPASGSPASGPSDAPGVDVAFGPGAPGSGSGSPPLAFGPGLAGVFAVPAAAAVFTPPPSRRPPVAPVAGGSPPDGAASGAASGNGHHAHHPYHSHHEGGTRPARACRECTTAAASRLPRDPACTGERLAESSAAGELAPVPPVGGERGAPGLVAEAEPDVAKPAAEEMEEPHDLAEADDPGAADDMWQLAWETACEVLAPTSAALQAAAHDLVDGMLAVTE